MYTIEFSLLIAGLAFLVIALIIFLAAMIRKSKAPGVNHNSPAGRLLISGLVLQVAGLVLITLSLIVRSIATGHGPFSNMYEFTLSFSWGIILMSLLFWHKYRIPAVNLVAMIISIILIIIALQLPSRHTELVPALQQSILLSLHVAVAIIAYGSFTTGFITAILLVWQSTRKSPDISYQETLDNISYQAVKIGFPFLTLVIILGAIWADIAWGSYWRWDPKETASLVTWLLYAGYLHTRLLHKWHGTRSAVLLIAGFCAVLFTFFGNYIFQSLHSYL